MTEKLNPPPRYDKGFFDLRETIVMWLDAHRVNHTHGWDIEHCADSLLTLFSQHGVVQLDENQDFAPFAGIPSGFYRVRPLEGK